MKKTVIAAAAALVLAGAVIYGAYHLGVTRGTQLAQAGAPGTGSALKAGDTMKAQMSLGNAQATCKQCHGMYREGDPQTGYKFNAASGITPP